MKFYKPDVIPTVKDGFCSSDTLLCIYQYKGGEKYVGTAFYVIEGDWEGFQFETGWVHVTTFNTELEGKLPGDVEFIGWTPIADYIDFNNIEFV